MLRMGRAYFSSPNVRLAMRAESHSVCIFYQLALLLNEQCILLCEDTMIFVNGKMYYNIEGGYSAKWRNGKPVK